MRGKRLNENIKSKLENYLSEIARQKLYEDIQGRLMGESKRGQFVPARG